LVCLSTRPMVDWDDVLSYKTARIVKIKDKRLFFLYAFFMFLIFCYIVVWNLGVKKNYLQYEEPLGTIRVSLRKPAPMYEKPISKLPYCTRSKGVYIGTDWRVFDQQKCKIADDKFAVYPATEQSAMLATTRATVFDETMPAGCNITSGGSHCQWKKVGSPDTLFITQIENYTLFIDHTMYAAQSGYIRNSKYMDGRMLNARGEHVDPCDDYAKGKCPKYVIMGKMDKADIIPLGTLLRAADTSLDSRAHPAMAQGAAKWESHRYAGVVLVMRIFYDNVYTFNTHNIRYTYTVHQVPRTEFKVEEPMYSVDKNGVVHRTVVDRHGIRIVFQQTGHIGVVDFQTFLIQMASSLGLLAVATVVVDLLATKVMDQRKFYEECKFLTTEDVTNFKEGEVPSALLDLLPTPTSASAKAE